MKAFAKTVESMRPAAIDALAARASKANRLAKLSLSPASRRLAYEAKARALIALLRLGADAARVVEVSLTTNLATVWIPLGGGRCFHCPFDAFDAEMRRLILNQVSKALNAA